MQGQVFGKRNLVYQFLSIKDGEVPTSISKSKSRNSVKPPTFILQANSGLNYLLKQYLLPSRFEHGAFEY